MPIEVEQSIPICLILSAVGGIIEVLATAILAYQDAQERQTMERWSVNKSRVALAANVTLQITSSVIGNLFATWFGPVSIVGPVFLVSQLVANMAVFGSFLGLESFTKDMKIGTYVVVTAAVILPVVGPAAQDDQDFLALLSTWWALLWSAANVLCMMASTVLLNTVDIHQLRESRRVALLLAARASSFTVNLTVSRVFVLGPTPPVMIAALILKISSGAINTHALVVQATAVEQAVFVPLNASALILVNAATGLVVWEDWRVVGSWIGYVCVFVQLVLGNYLLLGDVETLGSDNSKYGAVKSVRMMLPPKHRRRGDDDDGDDDDRDDDDDGFALVAPIADADDGPMPPGGDSAPGSGDAAVASPGRAAAAGGANRPSAAAAEAVASPVGGADGDERYIQFVDNDDDGREHDASRGIGGGGCGAAEDEHEDEERIRPPSSLSREPRARSRRNQPTRRQAWSVVYGVGDAGGGVGGGAGGRGARAACRQRSIFARDGDVNVAAEELANMRQII